MERRHEVQHSYDRLARQYEERIFDELREKPLDRALLTCFAEMVRDRGVVADVGCGPGHVARHLHDLGLPVIGIDLSPEMVAIARRRTPEVTFSEGDMVALDLPDAVWAGIVAFYSIIHLQPADVPRALREFHRLLRPNGLLLLAVHVGDEAVHHDELWGEPVSLDGFFYQPNALARLVTEAGYSVEARIERQPYPVVEYPSRRVYLLARRPLDERIG